MKLCRNGHDKDVTGVVKCGHDRKGKQKYWCRECLKVVNKRRNARIQVEISKWRWAKKHKEYERARSKAYYYANREKMLAYSAKRWREVIKPNGGQRMTFWMNQARESV